MQADILVLGHDTAGLQCPRHIQCLIEVMRRRHQPRAQFGLVAIFCEGDAIDRADIDAGIALDAQFIRKYGLHVAVQAALRLGEGEFIVKAKFDFRLDVLQREQLVAVWNLEAQIEARRRCHSSIHGCPFSGWRV